ncbi:hypothetical protein evm_005758 [Chilo suppressalis]|nr:hypothetical protein evm_005758 [Chilo suppressalis]
MNGALRKRNTCDSANLSLDFLYNRIFKLIKTRLLRMPRRNTVKYKENIENLPPSTENASTSSFTPRKPFEELSSKQKRRRVARISEFYSPEELNAATIQSLKTSGNEEISLIIKHLAEHPEDIAKLRSCLDSKTSKDTTYSPMQALAILVSLKLSKWQFISLRESASEQGMELYPSYHKIKLAKLECYPAKENIILTDEGASIKLQALLNLTAIRLLQAVEINTSV